jgi:hypothetical protein
LGARSIERRINLNNEEARQYFKDCNLSYADINASSLEQLTLYLKESYENFLEDYGTNAKEMRMSLAPMRKQDKKFEKDILKYAFIQVNGSYFSRRECISFNSDGFIGFAGWASTGNTIPIIEAFKKWCDWMARKSKNMKTITQGQIWQVVTHDFWSSGQSHQINKRDAKVNLIKDEYIEIRYPYEWHFRTIDNQYFHAYPVEILKHCRLIGTIKKDVQWKNDKQLLEIINDSLYDAIWD